MYREQNYIFSFTFVYKSKTACLIKHLFKKKKKERKRKEKKQAPTNHLPFIFWILKTSSFVLCFGFLLLQWHYFICNNRRGVAWMKFSIVGLVMGGARG